MIDATTHKAIDLQPPSTSDPADPEADIDGIALDRQPSGTPINIAASDDGSRLYMANSDGSISVIDTTTDALVDTQPPPTADPDDPEADIDPIDRRPQFCRRHGGQRQSPLRR